MILVGEDAEQQPEEPRVVDAEQDPRHFHHAARELVVLVDHLSLLSSRQVFLHRDICSDRGRERTRSREKETLCVDRRAQWRQLDKRGTSRDRKELGVGQILWTRTKLRERSEEGEMVEDEMGAGDSELEEPAATLGEYHFWTRERNHQDR